MSLKIAGFFSRTTQRSPYSPDRTPCNFILLHKIQFRMKGWCSDVVKEDPVHTVEAQMVITELPVRNLKVASVLKLVPRGRALKFLIFTSKLVKLNDRITLPWIPVIIEHKMKPANIKKEAHISCTPCIFKDILTKDVSCTCMLCMVINHIFYPSYLRCRC